MPRLLPFRIALLGIALMLGAPRTYAADAALIEAAKKEGQVVWYTSQIIDPLVLRLQEAFKKKYGIEVKPVRANSAEIALRILNEARGGKTFADIYGGQTTSEALKKEGLALRWLPDNVKDISPDFVDPEVSRILNSLLKRSWLHGKQNLSLASNWRRLRSVSRPRPLRSLSV